MNATVQIKESEKELNDTDNEDEELDFNDFVYEEKIKNDDSSSKRARKKKIDPAFNYF